MAQSATQRTTGSTRFRGPTVITLRGAGSKGKDYTLGGVSPVGSGLDVGLSVQVPTNQSANSMQVEKPDGTVVYAVDGSGNQLIAGGVLATYQQSQVTLSAANILAMNATPVAILPAPGASKVILVDMIHLQFKPGGANFAAGGAVTFVYHGGAVTPHAGNIPAATIQSASASNNLLAPITGVLQPPTNTGVDITNATGAFTTGTGTAIVTIWYSVVTLG